jgi:hypothetical protein
MKRRDFLGRVITTTGALTLGIGCGRRADQSAEKGEGSAVVAGNRQSIIVPPGAI